MKFHKFLVILILLTTVLNVLTFEDIDEKNKTKNEIDIEGRDISNSLPDSIIDCLADDGKCLMVCNQLKNGVYIYDLHKPAIPVWQITFEDAPDIGEKFKGKFKDVSDVKFFNNNFFAITTSNGGLALVDPNDNRISKYYILNANIHSVEIGPDEVIFLATSTDTYSISFSEENYDTHDNKRRAMVKFEGARAVFWDYELSVLWSGGGKKINKFQYNRDVNNPKLLLLDTVSPFGDSRYMWVTTAKNLIVFDSLTGQYFKRIEMENVNSVSTHPLLKDELAENPFSVTQLYRSRNKMHTDQPRNLDREQNDPRPLNETENYRIIKDMTDEELAKFYGHTVYVQPKRPNSWLEWWTNEVKELKYWKTILELPAEVRIYKARWLFKLPNVYRMVDSETSCEDKK